jgi:hypothetical protein
MTLLDTYPQATYEVHLDTPTGTRLALLESFSALAYARKRMTVGRAQITLPLDLVDASFIVPDAMLQVWRKPEDGARKLAFLGLARSIKFSRPEAGDLVTVGFEDGMSLLASRIVAYRTGTTKTIKSGPADNVMKALVRENLGASVTAVRRDLSGYGLVVEADVSQGPTIDMTFPWENILDALGEAAALALGAGTPTYFDMEPRVVSNTQLAWTFRTFVGAMGADRTYASGAPLVVGPTFGNLDRAELTFDYGDETTAVYAVGQGEGEDKWVKVFRDGDRATRSPWARRELVVFGDVQETTTALESAAKSALREGRPRIHLTGDLLDTPQARFGVDWDLGTKVVASFMDYQADVHIDAVEVKIDSQGRETVRARLESDDIAAAATEETSL